MRWHSRRVVFAPKPKLAEKPRLGIVTGAANVADEVKKGSKVSICPEAIG